MLRHSPTYFRRPDLKHSPARLAERRIFPRLQILTWIEYAYEQKNEFITGLVYNNSRGGFLLGSEFPFTPGEPLRIRISDPRPLFGKRKEILLTGQICWVRYRSVTSTLPAHEAGIRFEHSISSTTMQCLCTLLQLKP